MSWLWFGRFGNLNDRPLKSLSSPIRSADASSLRRSISWSNNNIAFDLIYISSTIILWVDYTLQPFLLDWIELLDNLSFVSYYPFVSKHTVGDIAMRDLQFLPTISVLYTWSGSVAAFRTRSHWLMCSHYVLVWSYASCPAQSYPLPRSPIQNHRSPIHPTLRIWCRWYHRPRRYLFAVYHCHLRRVLLSSAVWMMETYKHVRWKSKLYMIPSHSR